MHNTPVLKPFRIEALTDGLFATAMTVLVFSVNLPTNVTDLNLAKILTSNIMQIIFIYAGSFIILGTQWVKINIMQGFLDHANRPYFWMTILFLIPAGIVPFSTTLLIEYSDNPMSIVFYVTNLMLSSIIQYGVWVCGYRYKLYNAGYNEEINKLIRFRALIMPFAFYFLSLIVAYFHTIAAFVILVIQPLLHIMPSKVDHYINRRD